jgi:hypothetical protein
MTRMSRMVLSAIEKSPSIGAASMAAAFIQGNLAVREKVPASFTCG